MQYVQSNAFYKQLDVDVLSLEDLEFNDRSLILIKRKDGLPLKDIYEIHQMTEEEELVDQVKQQLYPTGVFDINAFK